jgi:plasmid stabilization system protein ParE
MLKLVLTERAESSLEEITDYYLTEHSVERATKVIHSIEQALDKIVAFPKSYPVCFDVKNPSENIRQIIVHHTFKIVYRIQKDAIEVIEIFHGNRNPELLEDING